MKLATPEVLRPGGLPLAARCALLCGACLWVGLLTLELVARNHARAMQLHERQRELVAREALNQRLLFLSEAHQPGVGVASEPMRGAPGAGSTISAAIAQAKAAAPKSPIKSAAAGKRANGGATQKLVAANGSKRGAGSSGAAAKSKPAGKSASAKARASAPLATVAAASPRKPLGRAGRSGVL